AVGLPAHALELARDLAGAHRAPGPDPDPVAAPFPDLRVRARADGRSGIRRLSAHRAAGCNLYADADVFPTGARARAGDSGVPRGVPDRRSALRVAGPGRNPVQALE